MALFRKLLFPAQPELMRVQDEVAAGFEQLRAQKQSPLKFGVLSGINSLSSGLLVDRYEINSGPTADLDFDFPVNREVFYCVFVKDGAGLGAGSTIQVQTIHGMAITNTMGVIVANNTIVLPTTIDRDFSGTLEGRIRFARVRGGGPPNNEAGTIYIISMGTTS